MSRPSSNPAGGPLRLFVGIDIGDAWATHLETVAQELRRVTGSSARWVRPALYHVTVVFLGNQQPGDVPDLRDALDEAAAGSKPFTLRLTGIRRLGGHERGALVAGVDDVNGGLLAFRQRLDTALRAREIAFDSKPLVPHVTLARPRGRAGLSLVSNPDVSGVPPLLVQRVNLVQSALLPSGPQYTALQSAELA